MRELCQAAHPRSRGENVSFVPPETAFRGSSPLTRGKQVKANPTTGEVGLIPAHAGKTRGGLDHGGPCAAHPRSRGENTS